MGLGANLGDPLSQLRAALGALRPERVSSLYRTEPLGDPGQPWYLNAVCELAPRAGPRALLRRLKTLERRAGRADEDGRWAPRVLDLDLLLYDDLVIDSPDLVLPHPGLTARRFVLEPLAELAPDLVEPLTGRTVRELLRTLDDPLRVEKLPESRAGADPAIRRPGGSGA